MKVKAAAKAHVCYPAHMFPRSSTHARRKQGEGLVDKLTQASRGFLISGPGQVALGVGPLTQRPRITEKQIPTLFHTYVRLHKNKLQQEGRKNKQQLWEGKDSEKDAETDVWRRLSVRPKRSGPFACEIVSSWEEVQKVDLLQRGSDEAPTSESHPP